MTTVDELIATAVRVGLCSARPLRGCSRAEIENLERDVGGALPSGYRRFLELGGHESGLLFRWDHFDVSFAHVAKLTQQERTRRSRDRHPQLPGDAFIICSRLGEQFELIRTEMGDESPVWYYSESAPSPIVEYPSFLEWLRANLEGAIEALESGYFDALPRGTEP